MKPKITVIVPIYNTEKYLAECLDSICKQTLKDIEILCINDGSPDDSLYIVRRYEYKYDNITILNQFNAGVGIARNNGIKFAKGEFVCFMDSDDYYLMEDTLEKLYINAKENDVKICGGSFSENHNEGKWIRKDWEGIYSKYTFTENRVMSYSEYQFDYGYHRFIYDRNLLIKRNIYYPEYIRFQDPPFFVKAMIAAGKFYAMKDVSYCYRYGHQKLNWTEKRIGDVLRGLIDNLRMSKEARLWELHELTIYRLTCEYQSIIKSSILSDEIQKLLKEAVNCINNTVLSKDKKYQSGLKALLE